MTQPVTTWDLPVTPEAHEALTAQGLTDLPSSVTLHLREATLRELNALDAALKRSKADPLAPYVLAIQKRAAQPVPEAVAREVAQDLLTTDAAELLWAFKEGRRDTEGKFREAVKSTMSGISDQLLASLGAAQPHFSATSMD